MLISRENAYGVRGTAFGRKPDAPDLQAVSLERHSGGAGQSLCNTQPCEDVWPELDICGHSTSPGSELDPEFPALVCTRPIGHDGLHHQEGVNCGWERP